jgi:hypothetical protein
LNTENYPNGMLKDLNEISSYTSDAISWFSGQFIKYVLNLKQNSVKFINNKIADMSLKNPYLG